MAHCPRLIWRAARNFSMRSKQQATSSSHKLATIGDKLHYKRNQKRNEKGMRSRGQKPVKRSWQDVQEHCGQHRTLLNDEHSSRLDGGTYDIRHPVDSGRLHGRGDHGGRRRPNDLGRHLGWRCQRLLGLGRSVSLSDNLGLDDYCERSMGTKPVPGS